MCVCSIVKDIHSILEVTVFDEDRDKKCEFLGKVAIPILRVSLALSCCVTYCHSSSFTAPILNKAYSPVISKFKGIHVSNIECCVS